MSATDATAKVPARHPGALRRGTRAITAGLGGRLTRLEPMGPGVHPWVALVVFLITAVISQRFAVAHIASVVAGNGPEDPPQFMWAMWWWPHALLHGLNPFVTHEIWYPYAFNLTTVTSTPGPALVLAPLTWVLGPVNGPIVSYNVAALAAPVLGAFCAYRLCLALTAAPAASILGGWLFGFSTYGFSQMEGHLNLVWSYLPALMALLVLRYARHEISARRVVLVGGAGLLFEMGCSTEILFTTTVLGVLTMVVAFLAAPARRAAIIAALAPLAGACLLAGLVGSVFLFYALSGPSVQVQPLEYSIDLLNLFIPTHITVLGGQKFAALTHLFRGNTAEQGAYLGVPLILMTVACWYSRWRRPLTRILAVMTLVALVWSMGEYLLVAGQQTNLTLPFRWVAGISPFNKLLPDRLSLYTALGAAAAAALWVAGAGRPQVGRWFLGVAAVIFLFPNANSYLGAIPLYREAFVSPPFITQGLYRRELRPGEIILPIPFGPAGASLLWQAQAQGYFREASGWFGRFPGDYATTPVVGQLAGLGPVSDTGAGLAAFIRRHHVGAVVVLAGQGGSWTGLLARLGLVPVPSGGVLIYRTAPLLGPGG